MAVAFGCDLCAGLQHGEPAQRVTVTPKLTGTTTTLVLCDACNAAFIDWREYREGLADA